MNRGTVDALSIVSEEFLEAQNNNNNHLVALFPGFQKAFDTVNHSLLLEKLQNYGQRVNVYIFWKVIQGVDINREVKGTFSGMSIIDLKTPRICSRTIAFSDLYK